MIKEVMAVSMVGGINLANCAHCGGEATIKSRGRRTIGMGESVEEYSLGCHTKPCLVHISVGGREDVEVLESLTDAILAWNTRAA